MYTYKIDNLTSTTPQAEQARLLQAIRSVPGVKTASLQTHSGSVQIELTELQHVKRGDISFAAAGAGFTVASA